MRTFLTLFFLSIIFSPTLKAEKPLKFYGGIEFYGYSEALPYQAFISDWNGMFKGGETALAHNWLTLGFSYKNWGVEIVRQNFTEMRFSKDSAEFYYLTKNKRPLITGRRYDIQLDMKRVSLEGIRLFKQLQPSKELSSQFGVTLLRGKKLLEGKITGFVTAQSEKNFRYDEVYVNYYYTEDIFLDRKVSAPHGIGYSLDTSIQWRPTEKTSLNFEIRNIFGYVFWKNTPFTAAQIISNNTTFDENGYVTVSPALSGQHKKINFKQKLPRVLRLTMVHQLMTKTHLIIDVLKTEPITFFSAGVQLRTSQHHQYSVLYNLKTQGVSIEYSNLWLAITLTSDALSYANAKNIGANIRITYE